MTQGDAANRPRQNRPARRWVRRTGQTLGAIVATSGFISCGVISGIAELPSFDHPAIALIFAGALVVFVVSAVLGAIWASVVLVRQLVLRWPRRRALKRMAQQIGWQWQPRAAHLHTSTRSALEHLRPGSGEDKPRPKFSEVLTGTFGGAPAIAFHVERGVSYELEVDQLVALGLPGMLPDLLVIDRAEDAYGVAARQQFESTRFNHHWRVDTRDPRYGSAFTHPRMMELLNSLDLSITEIRVRGSWLVSHAPTAFTPQLLQLHLDALARIAAQIPAWVWQDFSTAAPSANAGFRGQN